MIRLLLTAVFASVALPAFAQTATAQHTASSPATSPAAAIDAALVGRWEMVEVEQEGPMGAFEADVEVMVCQFGADGEATATMTVEQDDETFQRERTFRFEAAEGRIVSDGAPLASYEMVADDEVRLTMADGFTARFRRAAP